MLETGPHKLVVVGGKMKTKKDVLETSETHVCASPVTESSNL